MGLSYRDLNTAWVDGAGLKSKTTANQVSFFNHLIAPGEKYKYFWTDGVSEFEGAAKQLGAAWDNAQEGNNKHNARAERANGFILDGVRCLLLQSGLPMPWWPYALRYFCLCCNLKIDDTGSSAWFRRFGERFTRTRILFGVWET